LSTAADRDGAAGNAGGSARSSDCGRDRGGLIHRWGAGIGAEGHGRGDCGESEAGADRAISRDRAGGVGGSGQVAVATGHGVDLIAGSRGDGEGGGLVIGDGLCRAGTQTAVRAGCRRDRVGVGRAATGRGSAIAAGAAPVEGPGAGRNRRGGSGVAQVGGRGAGKYPAMGAATDAVDSRVIHRLGQVTGAGEIVAVAGIGGGNGAIAHGQAGSGAGGRAAGQCFGGAVGDRGAIGGEIDRTGRRWCASDGGGEGHALADRAGVEAAGQADCAAGQHGDAIGRVSVAEVNPAQVFAPGVAIELAGGRVKGHVNGHVIEFGREVDPAGGFAPGIAAQGAAAAVDAVVGAVGVGVGVRAAAAETAQAYPADIFGLVLQPTSNDTVYR